MSFQVSLSTPPLCLIFFVQQLEQFKETGTITAESIFQQLEQYKETGTVTAAIMGAPVVGGEDDDEDDEEEEDEFAYPGGTHGASVSGAVAMTSGQQQAFQSQQNMVTSSVQQGSSQNNQQFSNGQSKYLPFRIVLNETKSIKN